MSGYWGDLVKIVCRAATKRQHWHADFASHRPSRLFATGFWFLRVYHIAQHSPIMDSESSMASTPTLNTGKLTQPWRQPGDYFNHRTPHCSFSLRFFYFSHRQAPSHLFGHQASSTLNSACDAVKLKTTWKLKVCCLTFFTQSFFHR